MKRTREGENGMGQGEGGTMERGTQVRDKYE
jgi:hypothetical protein